MHSCTMHNWLAQLVSTISWKTASISSTSRLPQRNSGQAHPTSLLVLDPKRHVVAHCHAMALGCRVGNGVAVSAGGGWTVAGSCAIASRGTAPGGGASGSPRRTRLGRSGGRVIRGDQGHLMLEKNSHHITIRGDQGHLILGKNSHHITIRGDQGHLMLGKNSHHITIRGDQAHHVGL